MSRPRVRCCAASSNPSQGLTDLTPLLPELTELLNVDQSGRSAEGTVDKTAGDGVDPRASGTRSMVAMANWEVADIATAWLTGGRLRALQERRTRAAVCIQPQAEIDGEVGWRVPMIGIIIPLVAHSLGRRPAASPIRRTSGGSAALRHRVRSCVSLAMLRLR